MQAPTNILMGLTTTEVQERLQKYGPNVVPQRQFSFRHAVITRLWEPSAWILEAALLVEILLGKTIQAGFIVLMLLFAAVTGAIQAWRSDKVLKTLTNQLTLTVAVKRNNHWQHVSATQIVPNDVISLNNGDLLPADVQLLDGTLEVDESSISGESRAIRHQAGELVYAGTEIKSGHGLAVVVSTGKHSRSGKTISLINQSSAPGQLQKLLSKIIGYLAILDTVLAIVLVLTAIIRGANLITMLPFLAMLFIATIPIAMPSSFAVANSVEAKQLGQTHILVSDLSGIQAAANLNLLLIDKTGTITANQPTVVAMHNFSQYSDRELICWATSATNQQNASVIDAAILNYARQQAVNVQVPAHFEPFNSQRGYSEGTVLADQPINIKLGAYQRLYQLDQDASKLTNQIDFSRGRTVALLVNDKLVALFIVEDQPRPDSLQAIKKITDRGVKVIMLTGDNQKTAATVAQQVGLTGNVMPFNTLTADTDPQQLAGITEVIPEHKLAIVQRFQKLGYVVGMTGDGVNDAPALKQADVGIAVQNAVDLAKRSAKLVLLKPGLTPIIQILDSGHRVYQRMMTWTITKLSRTAELTMLLTLGFLIWQLIPLSLNAMILVAILNDCVTLVLGTDRTHITSHPERWDLRRLSKIAGVLAIGWTTLGMGVLYEALHRGLTPGQISTVLYCYLIFSAMLTILMTRTTKPFWQQRPSNSVIIAITINCLITAGLALTGLGIAKISLSYLLVTLAIVLVMGGLLTIIQPRQD
ncbi:HAD-IC family P-type ATPase [Lactiplantibacillus plantarum]|uniref:HAD-IC family P-type ATPase n=1 Tax=Lactiplantibacillus plantarum TaxID=1590 RepID=UPI0015EC4363|nr:HAD-IC family P-type ATPase [Lactiplantibacillus plantarum]QLQ51140.1 HAD-IC family P-type ATPase [Lactiplantibacillus plantarum]WDQ20804.1 HAD-IC family P-type ATPase [Lactiplantibacillus plantarum]WGF85749.1 HAD-IC family P-type ATPase [Lactiplantibacillus plantarum]WGG43074.1 HAD-IC family P-type ATPase [Lactiplantibacillus plantarum]WMX72124.1 HAD-IC family P-type ATPase [Lactiplantibacillus plantarum]